MVRLTNNNNNSIGMERLVEGVLAIEEYYSQKKKIEEENDEE